MTAVIVNAVRTPVGKRNGGLSGIHPADLSALVLDELTTRSGLDPALIDDVIWGCVAQVGEQAVDIARTAVLSAGWPETVPGVTIDRQCGSSQQSLDFAVAAVSAGHCDVVVAGGVESMSRIPIGTSSAVGGVPVGPAFLNRYGSRPHQGLGAEMIAEKWGLGREELDAYASRSHQRAAAAQAAGHFREQSMPVTVDAVTVSDDEGIRPTTTVDSLAHLKPAFKEDGVIHAGNSSQISDGAAAVLVMSEAAANEHGLTPMARVVAASVAASDPVMMLTAPIPATTKALRRSGLSIDDIEVFEVNEAFAPVPIAWQREFGVDDDRLNPNGGAIALGHPLGGSGARILTDLLFHMRRNSIRYGLQTMCEGGGQANATIVEVLD
ncbi:thiolase family protein [Mycolicibacterium vinylchloridicum]|uniref:thiolase family protein n=1 Tax=Mycolicibacterium vinylchloridicum TaxID=2736928 RepID=UPI0015CAA926|nr:thiolase family protein [Mycolicibacterium vinylchloridicum]